MEDGGKMRDQKALCGAWCAGNLGDVRLRPALVAFVRLIRKNFLGCERSMFVRILTLFLTGDWKVPGTRRLESLRYTGRAILPVGSVGFAIAATGPIKSPN